MTIELDPSKVSPQTHVFLGMFRPPIESISRNESCNKWKSGWCDVCAGGAVNIDDQKWKCWIAGHFDIPQYRLIEEEKAKQKPDPRPILTAIRNAITSGARSITLLPEAYEELREELRFTDRWVVATPACDKTMHIDGIPILKEAPKPPQDSIEKIINKLEWLEHTMCSDRKSLPFIREIRDRLAAIDKGSWLE